MTSTTGTLTARLADLAAQLPTALTDDDFDGDYASVLADLARAAEALATTVSVIADHASQMAEDDDAWDNVFALSDRTHPDLLDSSHRLQAAAECAGRGQVALTEPQEIRC